MIDTTSQNLLYFANASMRGLYNCMKKWQNMNYKQPFSVNIQRDGDMFCCIALVGPIEVVICNGSGSDQAEISRGCLYIDKVYDSA